MVGRRRRGKGHEDEEEEDEDTDHNLVQAFFDFIFDGDDDSIHTYGSESLEKKEKKTTQSETVPSLTRVV
jgi:hypothetical protein